MKFAADGIWTRILQGFLILTLSVGAFAQGGTGELTGLVTDSTGAVVSGVEVKLSNAATGESRSTVTTPAGTYLFPALPIVGTYSLEVTNKGFKSVKVQDVVLSVGTIVSRDIKLDVGSASEEVTVEAGAQQVQTEDSALSENLSSAVWTSMPLETRSQNEFMGLIAGSEPAVVANLATDRGPAVNGTRSGSGNFMVDGFSNNDQGLGGAAVTYGSGGALTTISPDAIQEYRVIDNTPPAEYGQAGGFVTDTVLKSGTNQWHGSLFEYNRIQLLAANQWFSNNGGSVDHLVRNQFGGSVGGPIIKDKTFFYFTTEFHRLRATNPLTGGTFTTAFQQFVSNGGFENFVETSPNGICNNQSYITALLGPGATAAPCPGAFAGTSTLGPTYAKEIALQPPVLCTVGAANCNPNSITSNAQGLYTGGVLGIPGITYPVPIFGTVTVPQSGPLNQARYSAKFDHKLGARDQLNGSYLYDNADAHLDYGGNGTFGPTIYEHQRAQVTGLTWAHTFSPTVLNQARVSYVRHTGNFPGDPTVAGMTDSETAFDETSIGLGNSDNIPQFFTENEFIYKDDVSVARGKNNFKVGGEYRRTRNGSTFYSVYNGFNLFQDTEDLITDGNFTNDLEAALLGGPQFGSLFYAKASINPETGSLPNYYRGYRANEVAAYVQDDWRVNPHLTVNLGVRWEYFGPPHNFQPGLDANFFPGNPVTPIPTTSTNPFFPVNNAYLATFATGASVQVNHNIWAKNLKNFGPRVGFSWDALGNQKLVVRGGFGINYDRIYNNIFENLRFNPPAFGVASLGTIGGNGQVVTPAQTAALVQYPYVGRPVFAGTKITPELRAINPDLATPYYEQAHFGFQYQIAKDMVVESNYVGTFGHQLLGILAMNTYDGRESGGDSTLLNPNYASINYRNTCCNSNYHAWQTTFRKRFSSGLQFNANYTFSKAMDELSDAFTNKTGLAATFPTEQLDPKFDYGPSDFNVKHRVVGSFVYDLPFAKSNRWLGGWQFSGIVSVQTGADFPIENSSVDSNGDGDFNDRAVYIGPGKITNAINHNVSPAHGYLNASPSYWGSLNGPTTADETGIPCTANGGAWCNGPNEMEKNTLVGPGFFNTDIGFAKSFKINERSALKFEGNFFNVFNHPNFLPPAGNLNASNFGQSTATFNNLQSGGPRITQLALRFDF